MAGYATIFLLLLVALSALGVISSLRDEQTDNATIALGSVFACLILAALFHVLGQILDELRAIRRK